MRSERTVSFSAPLAAVGFSETWLKLIGPVSDCVTRATVATVLNLAMNNIGAIGGAPRVTKPAFTMPRGFVSRRKGAEIAVLGTADSKIFFDKSARLSVGVV